MSIFETIVRDTAPSYEDLLYSFEPYDPHMDLSDIEIEDLED
jgi:hypothetical protein